MDVQGIKKVLDSEAGVSMKEWLMFKCSELRNIYNVKDVPDPEHFAVEGKAQRKAFEKLAEILSEIVTFENADFDKRKDPRDNYDIDG